MKKISTLLFILNAFTVFGGGGWVQKKGEGYFKLNQSSIVASSFFDTKGNTLDITTFRLYTSSLYAEYGISNRFTLSTYMPFYVRNVLNEEVSANTGAVIGEGDAYGGFGDMNLAVDYAILQNKRIALSVRAHLGIASGSTGTGQTGLLQTGDGEWNQMIQVNAGTSFGKFYSSIFLGINNRTEQFSEELKAGAEIGYAHQKSFIAVKWFMNQSFFNGNEFAGAEGSVFSNNIEYNVLATEAGYNVTPSLGINAGVIVPLTGRRTLNALNYNIGIHYILKK